MLLVITAVDAQVLGFQFLSGWDDGTNIYHNPLYTPLTWQSLVAFWQHPYYQLYLPVTYTVWAALVALSRVMAGTSINIGPINPILFHATNLLTHLGAVTMVFLILEKIFLRIFSLNRRSVFSIPESLTATLPLRPHYRVAAAAGALLFGLHPVQVETIAWTSCLRDLLGAFFSLAAIFVFLRFLEEGGKIRKRSILFITATLLFLLALGSKPGTVIVPALALLLGGLLLLQNEQQREAQPTTMRFFSLCWLIPWFLIALFAVVITFYVQPAASIARDLIPAWVRPFIAADSLAFYLFNILWPFNLCADYGHSPNVVFKESQLYWTWILPLGVGIALLCWKQRKNFQGNCSQNARPRSPFGINTCCSTCRNRSIFCCHCYARTGCHACRTG
ncbi:MAG TPA: hypothetical protein VJK54_10835 [Chthoniobacterales bacterium]|nr:hypothetical protein [Chthoniobacterales bacterium]